ncbi:hypothetical protein N7512_001389 [Penicillium capsulatum]|nr:hypothetical protein N7512_001389 [Penicillium capsulatum]
MRAVHYFPLEICLVIADFLVASDLLHLVQAIPALTPLLSPTRLQCQDVNGDTVLHLLAANGLDSHITPIADDICQSNVGNYYGGMTPLHMAVANGHYSTTALLLKMGADASIRNNKNEIPLHLACRTRSPASDALVNLLLDYGADAATANNDGFTPLHEAVIAHQSPAVLRKLIQAGADVNAQAGRLRWTPLFYAIRFSQETPDELLASSGGEPASSNGSANRGVEIVQTLLKAKPDLTIRDREGRTVLIQMARIGANEVLRLLLRAGVDLEDGDNQGRDALCTAAIHGHRSTAKRLMRAGACLWIRDDNCRNAAHLAHWYGHEDLAYMILNAQRRRPWRYCCEKFWYRDKDFLS